MLACSAPQRRKSSYSCTAKVQRTIHSLIRDMGSSCGSTLRRNMGDNGGL
jgi:hypothetical protein